MASIVFSHPAEPHTSVGHPRGSPPPVISLRPAMSVGISGGKDARLDFVSCVKTFRGTLSGVGG